MRSSWIYLISGFLAVTAIGMCADQSRISIKEPNASKTFALGTGQYPELGNIPNSQVIMGTQIPECRIVAGYGQYQGHAFYTDTSGKPINSESAYHKVVWRIQVPARVGSPDHSASISSNHK